MHPLPSTSFSAFGDVNTDDGEYGVHAVSLSFLALIFPIVDSRS